MLYIYDYYIMPWFKRGELAFWRYPWLSFMVSALLCLWVVVAFNILLAESLWLPAFVITSLVLFGLAPLVISIRVENNDYAEGEVKKLRNEIKELEEQR